MGSITRRSILRTSLGAAALGTFARPHAANAAATTATMWVVQGFVPEEDAAYKQLVVDYQKASGNTIDYSIIPFAPMRQKAVSAITAGVVPDCMETADFSFLYLNTWRDNLQDVSDVYETQKEHWSKNAFDCSFAYNNATKKRAYYQVPWKSAAVPFHIWKSLVEKSGQKVTDIPKTWDAFHNFFKPVQDGLRKAGMRNVYGLGYQLAVTPLGADPVNTFNAFMIAHGGAGFITPDGQLHTKDPQIKEAAIKAVEQLSGAFKAGYVPPDVINWNDADDNNAFHSKLIVMDFDGTISTEVALYHDKEQYDDILTLGLPLDNQGKEIAAQVFSFGMVVPKGAKNPTVAKDFMKYAVQPDALNTYLKAGLGRWAPPMGSIAKNDPFWLKQDPHRTAYTTETLLGPTVPVFEAYNPGMAEVDASSTMMNTVVSVIKNGMSPQAAVEAAFKRAETLLAKYPIAQA
jgi:multiple sugar transport system substrate-binding protein